MAHVCFLYSICLELPYTLLRARGEPAACLHASQEIVLSQSRTGSSDCDFNWQMRSVHVRSDGLHHVHFSLGGLRQACYAQHVTERLMFACWCMLVSQNDRSLYDEPCHATQRMQSAKFQLAMLTCYINLLAALADYLAWKGLTPVLRDTWGQGLHIGRIVSRPASKSRPP